MRQLTATATALATCLAAPALAATEAEVMETYADIAHAAYGDALGTAERLRGAVGRLVAEPSPQALQAAREAWLAARVPYQQTEAFRFGNPIVDDWEGRVNAWPLDEGLIDYVAAEGSAPTGPTDENALAGLNVIANERLLISGREVDAGAITPALLEDALHEADAVEANVATGYHAIEFLLWGQDLHGTEPGTGERPWTDYAAGEDCTNGHCERRGEYLTAAADLLVSDLEWMVGQWAEGAPAREAAAERGVEAILTGMGSLSYGELAGERMKLGVLLNDPEEEHDCFSDNTHNSHFYDAMGIRNVYLGRYTGVDGTVTEGPGVTDLVAEADPAADAALKGALDATMMEMAEIKAAAEAGFRYDRMLAPGSEAGEALVMSAVDALVAQTREIERAMTALGRGAPGFEGSDSLDDPDAVFQ